MEIPIKRTDQSLQACRPPGRESAHPAFQQQKILFGGGQRMQEANALTCKVKVDRQLCCLFELLHLQRRLPSVTELLGEFFEKRQQSPARMG